MPQQITYDLIIQLKRAINFLIEDLDLQISDIARAMPANLGNLTGYLKLQPADKLPKRKTLENHYANLITAYNKELKPFLQGEGAVQGAKEGDEEPIRPATGLSLEQGISALLKEQAEIHRKIGEMETMLRKIWEKRGKRASRGSSWGD